MIYVEVLKCENAATCPVPQKILENTLRFTRSEEDLTQLAQPSNGSPRPEFTVCGPSNDFDDADCWSQEDDDIIAVRVDISDPKDERLKVKMMIIWR